MLFGLGKKKNLGDKKKRLEEALEGCAASLAKKDLAEAKKLSEAARALSEELDAEPQLAWQTAVVSLEIAIAQGEWPRAQGFLERAVQRLDAMQLPRGPHALQARHALASLLLQRERFEEAERLARDTMNHAGTETAAYAQNEAIVASAMAHTGRLEEAVQLLRARFERCRQQGDHVGETVQAARRLAHLLDEHGVHLEEALALAIPMIDLTTPTNEASVLHILQCGATVVSALNQLGRHDEALVGQRRVMGRVAPFMVPGQHGRLALARVGLECAGADAWLARGEVDAAIRIYRGEIRSVETSAGARDRAMLPALDGLARALRKKQEVREAELTERRASAIRMLITGKKPSPSSPRGVGARPEPLARPQVWPRRTPAGLYTLRGAPEPVIRNLLMTTRSAPRGVSYVMEGADLAQLAVGASQDCNQPAIVLLIQSFQTELERAVALANSAGNRIELVPWFQVNDLMPVRWSEWPVGEKERIEREVLPRIDGWRMVSEGKPSWFGPGVVASEQGLQGITPLLYLEYAQPQGIWLKGIAPPELLDRWIPALCRETGFLPLHRFTPFLQAAPSGPIARA